MNKNTEIKQNPIRKKGNKKETKTTRLCAAAVLRGDEGRKGRRDERINKDKQRKREEGNRGRGKEGRALGLRYKKGVNNEWI